MSDTTRNARGTRFLGPEPTNIDRSDRFDRIEHLDILEHSADHPSDKVDDLSSINAIAQGFEGDKPICLFPIRLETKYVDSGNKLWIRIFPDKIHHKSHERPLTSLEEQSGMNYWQAVYDADGDTTLEKEAWGRLVNVYGIERAAWIRKQMYPTN